MLGIGEIGLNKNTKNELTIFEEHVEIAKKYDLPILIHTPHLEDKLKGTKLILDALKNAQVDPDKVIIDHVEEHTTGIVLDAGFWAGMTLYPESKCTAARAIDIFGDFWDGTHLDELGLRLGNLRPLGGHQVCGRNAKTTA